MQVEPALLKQLLDMQLLRSLNVSGSDDESSPDTEDTGLDFTQLLQQIIGEQADGTTSSGKKIIPAEQLLAQSNMAAAAFQWAGTRQAAGAPLTADSLSGASSSSAYDSLIQAASARHQVDSGLVKAVIQAESSFNHKAVSPAGAKGLMQLMDGTAAGFGITNSFDPQQNIEGGTQFLSNLLNKYNGNEGVVLAAYNAGPNRVDRLGIRTDADLQAKMHLLPKETQDYVSRVLGYKSRYDSAAAG